MKTGPNTQLWTAASALLLVALAVLAWLFWPRGAAFSRRHRMVEAVSPVLDARFKYDAALWSLAGSSPNAEYALELNSLDAAGKPDGVWGLYGKRIQGLGALLAKAPGAMLYDFVGTQHAEEFEQASGLKPIGAPLYEDVQLHGGLGLHQVLSYSKPSDGKWAKWFPAAVARGESATVEGWVFFQGNDLFFFYAVAAQPLSNPQRQACLEVVESLQYGVLQGAASAQDEGDADADKVPGGDAAPGESAEGAPAAPAQPDGNGAAGTAGGK